MVKYWDSPTHSASLSSSWNTHLNVQLIHLNIPLIHKITPLPKTGTSVFEIAGFPVVFQNLQKFVGTVRTRKYYDPSKLVFTLNQTGLTIVNKNAYWTQRVIFSFQINLPFLLKLSSLLWFSQTVVVNNETFKSGC